jgi:predicted Zn-dependent protease
MAEDLERVMSEMTAKIERAVGKRRPSNFNSAELFLSLHDRTLHLSNGFTHRGSQSRIYSETAYSFTKNGKSDEYLNSRWAVSLDELDIDELFDETSDRVEHSLDVEKPMSGKYPVIIDAEVLATLFNGHISQLHAKNSYQGLPFLKVGLPLIPEAHADLVTLTLDPHLEYGADTAAVSSDGTLQEPIQLVDRNQVVATATDKRYADYLKTPMTSVRGSVVVELGSRSHAELTRAEPRVIEILQFSGLFADPNSGTFSSEIRLAKLYDNEKGTVTWLKGGSLAGSITENFQGVRFSNKRVKRSHFSSNELRGTGYYGPDFALLSDVSIVG